MFGPGGRRAVRVQVLPLELVRERGVQLIQIVEGLGLACGGVNRGGSGASHPGREHRGEKASLIGQPTILLARAAEEQELAAHIYKAVTGPGAGHVPGHGGCLPYDALRGRRGMQACQEDGPSVTERAERPPATPVVKSRSAMYTHERSPSWESATFSTGSQGSQHPGQWKRSDFKSLHAASRGGVL